VMMSALQLVFSGGIYIPPEILAREQAPPCSRIAHGHPARPSVARRARGCGADRPADRCSRS
jgi:hypothetical protein